MQVTTVDPGTASPAVIKAAFLGQDEVEFTEDLKVRVEGGRLTKVVIEGPAGTIPGDFRNGATVWRSETGTLDYDTTYAVTATAVDLRGNVVQRTGEFTTLEPTAELVPEVYPYEGGTYGVGMPIEVRFSHPVEDKAAVQERLVVTTDKKGIEGAWNWESDDKVTYRPREYWPADTEVNVDLNLKGVESSEGVYGLDNTSTSFTIGSSMVTIVDAATHYATVYQNGSPINTIPITTGKPGWETRSGIKVIMSKERMVVMDGATLGISEDDDEYYRLDVPYAMRVTWSGEFVHAAPWSVGSQGVANVSHGCVGMSLSNAAWLYDQSKVGDIVEVRNTGRSQDLGNGITVWNESWADWSAGSAI